MDRGRTRQSLRTQVILAAPGKETLEPWVTKTPAPTQQHWTIWLGLDYKKDTTNLRKILQRTPTKTPHITQEETEQEERGELTFLRTSYTLEMILYVCVKASKVCFSIAALQMR